MLVTPEQARHLIGAMDIGKVKLTLRHPNEPIDAKSDLVLGGASVKVSAKGAAELSGATAKVAGQASAELSASGVTTVKGTMVKIN